MLLFVWDFHSVSIKCRILMYRSEIQWQNRNEKDLRNKQTSFHPSVPRQPSPRSRSWAPYIASQ